MRGHRYVNTAPAIRRSAVLTGLCGYKKKAKSVNRTRTRSEQHIYIKVGCAKEPRTRARNWNGECRMNKFELHGIWPKHEATPAGLTPNRVGYGDPYLYRYLLEGARPAWFRFGKTNSWFEGLIKYELEYLARTSSHLPKTGRPTTPEPEECPCKYVLSLPYTHP